MKTKAFIVMLFMGLGISAVAQNPKNPPDPPPPPPCECDVEGMERVAVHSYTPTNPKSEETTVGKRAEVDILFYNPPQVVDGKTICLQYTPNGNNQWDFYASGGQDSDVYVNPDNELDFVSYGAPHKYTFRGGSGGSSASSCGVLTFSPPEPGEDGCDTYTITAIAEEGLDRNCEEDNPDCPKDKCSVHDGAKESKPVTVKVWKCLQKHDSEPVSFTIWLINSPLMPPTPFKWSYTAHTNYMDCNGDICGTGALIDSFSSPFVHGYHVTTDMIHKYELPGLYTNPAVSFVYDNRNYLPAVWIARDNFCATYGQLLISGSLESQVIVNASIQEYPSGPKNGHRTITTKFTLNGTRCCQKTLD